MSPASVPESVWLAIAVACALLGGIFTTLRLALLDLSIVGYARLKQPRETNGALSGAPSGSPSNTASSDGADGDESNEQTLAADNTTEPDDAIMEHPLQHAMSVALPALVLRLSAALAMVCWSGSFRHDVFTIDLIDLCVGLGAGGALVWIFAVMLPQSLADHGGARVVYRLRALVRLSFWLTWPLRLPAGMIDEIVRRLTGAERLDQNQELEAELREVVEEGERGGQIDEVEREMIEAVVEFRTTSVERIMTPRTEVMALAYTDDLSAVKQGVRELGHSRIPVYREDMDHIVGLLYARDLLAWLASEDRDADAPDAQFVLQDLLRPAMFVPETKSVRELLRELLGAQVHIALVADEYGGTSGLVTMEDIVEEVFGDIQDEYEDAVDEDATVRLDPSSRSAVIDARVYIDDANDRLEDIELELPEHEDYDTVGGYVVVGMGCIPQAGETWQDNGLLVTVLDAEATRVVQVRVEPAPRDQN
jgi:putative hemolysin